MPIQLTVALPMYRAKHIAWLILEALSRQRDVNFNWELVVAEEQEPLMFGRDHIMTFKERLEARGCTRIEYIPVQKWIPLSRKWCMLAQAASPSSEVFAFQAADTFCHPYRLRTAFDATLGEADWSQDSKIVLYHIASGKTILLDREVKASWGYHKCGDNMAVKTILARSLPSQDRAAKVDMWLYLACGRAKGGALCVVWNDDENWKLGFHTKGLNNVSGYNRETFDHPKPPFRTLSYELSSVVPSGILDRLVNLRPLAQGWKVRPWSKS